MRALVVLAMVTVALAGGASTKAQETSGQETPVLSVRIGGSSSEAVRALGGAYSVSDTVWSDYMKRKILRFAPVKLGGLEGLLVVQVDTLDRVVELCWSRKERGLYSRSAALDAYDGWDEWRHPSSEQIEQVRMSVREVLGEGDIQHLVDADDIRAVPPVSAWNRITWSHNGALYVLGTLTGMLELCASSRQ